MLGLGHTKLPCSYCGRGLMPIKRTDWDCRKYHKKCFKEMKIIELAKERLKIIEADEYRRFEILNKIKKKL